MVSAFGFFGAWASCKIAVSWDSRTPFSAALGFATALGFLLRVGVLCCVEVYERLLSFKTISSE
jgi:hypothetical protein